MNNDRLEALLWARIDGTIETDELAELEAYLAENPEPRDIERQITMMAGELARMEKMQPPSELRDRIDGALANATPPVAHQAASLLARPIPSWQARWLPLTASLVIGVAIGFLLHPDNSGSIDQSGVTGTMLGPPAAVVSAPVGIHLDDGDGTVTASRSGKDVVVDVTLVEEIELAVTLAGHDGQVLFESLTNADGSPTEVTTEQGWVAVRSWGPGKLSFSVKASDAGAPLRIQVSVDGKPVDEAWIASSRNELAP